MPQAKWSSKRERQYEHIKESARSRGKSSDEAERIAAATVNKERARAGESETVSPSSLRGPSPSRRGGLRSHKGAAGPTRDSLYREAKARGIKGRSKMSKSELKAAVGMKSP
jgi:tryptophanyl-tRNA synthetase